MREAKLSAAPLHSFCGLVHIIEIKFPELGIRFIAINDGVDSEGQAGNDFTPFYNIINENLTQRMMCILATGKMV